ncbi:MAG TPA: hypothetical protein H9862_07690 [Candidatus Akkermansia intestinigallinarum]|uniref:ATP-dependent DNA helicase RecG C-terminal domain-containing protein n=1 Tax=Candidatus Akkermansia intestinigallinarum TaxID=2838431 RepID=A0A9D2AHG5_9BACT|nr:hypothetical protein [Candidatus Akkermansia intestinigallinarum]
MPSNPSLAEAFKYLGLIEKWGSGIGRISHALRESNLPDATYDNNVAGYRSFLRVTMKRLPARSALPFEQNCGTHVRRHSCGADCV